MMITIILHVFIFFANMQKKFCFFGIAHLSSSTQPEVVKSTSKFFLQLVLLAHSLFSTDSRDFLYRA